MLLGPQFHLERRLGAEEHSRTASAWRPRLGSLPRRRRALRLGLDFRRSRTPGRSRRPAVSTAGVYRNPSLTTGIGRLPATGPHGRDASPDGCAVGTRSRVASRGACSVRASTTRSWMAEAVPTGSSAMVVWSNELAVKPPSRRVRAAAGAIGSPPNSRPSSAPVQDKPRAAGPRSRRFSALARRRSQGAGREGLLAPWVGILAHITAGDSCPGVRSFAFRAGWQRGNRLDTQLVAAVGAAVRPS